MLKSFYPVILLFVCLSAVADIRFSAGINQTMPAAPGAWYQPPLPYEWHLRSPTYAIEVSEPLTHWLSWSVGYADRGSFSAQGKYVSDPDYAIVKSGGQCCDKYFYGKVHGSTRAITVTLDPTWHITEELSVFVQAGVSFYEAKFAYEWLPVYDCAARACYGDKFDKRGVSPYYGVGIQFSSWFVQAYRATMEKAPESIGTSNVGIRVGYAFHL